MFFFKNCEEIGQFWLFVHGRRSSVVVRWSSVCLLSVGRTEGRTAKWVQLYIQEPRDMNFIEASYVVVQLLRNAHGHQGGCSNMLVYLQSVNQWMIIPNWEIP